MKVFFWLAGLTALFLAGCSNLSVSIEDPEDNIATQVAATVSAMETVAPTPSPLPTDPPPAPTHTAEALPALNMYQDPELGFRVSHDPSWDLSATNGTGLSILDGRGRVLTFEKQGYRLEITVLDGVADPGCGGLLGPDFNLDDFHVFQIDGTEVWRIRAENGLSSGFSMGDFSFLEVLSPEEIYPEPDENGYSGLYSCRFVISEHLTAISYLLPLSPESLAEGGADEMLLAEMDAIMTSLTWNQ